MIHETYDTEIDTDTQYTEQELVDCIELIFHQISQYIPSLRLSALGRPQRDALIQAIHQILPFPHPTDVKQSTMLLPMPINQPDNTVITEDIFNRLGIWPSIRADRNELIRCIEELHAIITNLIQQLLNHSCSNDTADLSHIFMIRDSALPQINIASQDYWPTNLTEEEKQQVYGEWLELNNNQLRAAIIHLETLVNNPHNVITMIQHAIDTLYANRRAYNRQKKITQFRCYVYGLLITFMFIAVFLLIIIHSINHEAYGNNTDIISLIILFFIICFVGPSYGPPPSLANPQHYDYSSIDLLTLLHPNTINNSYDPEMGLSDDHVSNECVRHVIKQIRTIVKLARWRKVLCTQLAEFDQAVE